MDLASSCVVKLLCFFTFQAELFVAERHCFLRHSLWFLVLFFFFYAQLKSDANIYCKKCKFWNLQFVDQVMLSKWYDATLCIKFGWTLDGSGGVCGQTEISVFIVSYSKFHVFIIFLSMLQGYMTLSRKWVNYPTALRPHRGRKTVTVILKMKWNCIFCLFI